MGDGIATAASLAAMVALAYLFGWWGLVVGIFVAAAISDLVGAP